MKKTKFLSLLVLAPLMTGCGTNVKAPKFAKKGDEVKYADFVNNLDKLLEKASFKKEKKLGQSEFKMKNAYNDTYEKIRGKKTIVKSVDYQVTEEDHKYDPNKIVDRYVFKGEIVQTLEEPVGKSVDKSTMQHEDANQYHKIGEKEYLVHVEGDKKQYTNVAEISKSDLVGMFDFQAKNYAEGIFDDVFDLLGDYEAAPEKEQKNYKFYRNGNIFTIELEVETTEEHKVDDKVDYVTVTKGNVTAQVDVTEGKWSSKTYMHSVSDREFKINVGEFAKGDISRETNDSAFERIFEVKEVKVEPFDLKDFAGFGFEE